MSFNNPKFSEISKYFAANVLQKLKSFKTKGVKGDHKTLF